MLPIQTTPCMCCTNIIYSSLPTRTDASIKDVTCYLIWSIARSFNPDHIHSVIDQIYTNLCIVMLLEKDINNRRAAQAAFQVWTDIQQSFLGMCGSPWRHLHPSWN